ncbi:MAG: phenylalanine--tRNA ligase subunit alpha [archaeon]
MSQHESIVSSLSPIERKILPFLECKSAEELAEKSKTDMTTVLRALEFLSNKKIVEISYHNKKNVILGSNGIIYLKEGLPERKLLNVFSETVSFTLDDARKKSGLSENEFKAALGALKKKALLNVENRRMLLQGTKENVSRRMPEEVFLGQMPLEADSMTAEQKYCYEQLKNRKDIARIEEQRAVSFKITEAGRKIISEPLGSAFVEQLTPEMLRKGTWKGKKFRKYDIVSRVPRIYGGRRQPYYSFLNNVRDKLVAMGFEEMHGSLVENEFWNYDALFQPQFHPAREWSSTYYVKNKLKPEQIDKKIISAVKAQHESSWRYEWKIENALKSILRPQGTVLSARQLPEAKIPGKYFAIARCYRPDVVDASHLPEFNQVEGIIVQENLTLRNLFHVLELFAKEIANATEIKFVPHYFPFTEPSVELHAKHEKLGWIELGGAGILRREVVKSLTGKDITVLAWGLGIDRLAMFNLNINDIRQLFSQDIDWLRGIK